MKRIVTFLSDNFIVILAILSLSIFKVLAIYHNLEKNTYLSGIVAVINAMDTFVYMLFFVWLAVKHIYFKFSKILSLILYQVYPLKKQILFLENEIRNVESTYRFTTYPFKTIARRELYKLLVRTEINAYYDICKFYDMTTDIYDYEVLFAEWFSALNQLNISSYQILTGRLKLPSPIIDKIYEHKNDYYYFLYKFIQLRPAYNSYYLNVCLLYLSHTLFKQYVYKLAKIINEINSQLEGLPFTIYDNGVYREYRLNSNEVIESS